VGRRAGSPRCDQPLGGLDCNRSIAAIRIRADGFAEFLVQRRSFKVSMTTFM
jgi:hypothetical protein